MSAIEQNTEHHAVTRLYELVRSGEVHNTEFSQLDSLVYRRFMQTYDVDADAVTESIS